MKKKILMVFSAICLQALMVFAQTPTGRIVGTVNAPDGVVPGATIVVRDNQTGREQTATSSSTGNFNFPQLEFGTYTVTITAPGYKSFVANEVKIDVGREYPLNALLEVGQITEQVTVTAGAEQINSTNAELSTTISTQQVRELPLNGRNPLSLVNLQAGGNPNNNNVNGTRTASTTVTRDGVSIQDNYIRTGRSVPDAPSVDDVSEITVITQNAGVETGGGSSVIQLVTPRGGNKFHGNLFAFNRNSAFTANSRSNKQAGGTDAPFLNRNQFGGSISGPTPIFNFGEGGPMFLKDKAYFFFNYEGFRLARQAAATARTLLPQARTGEFTYVDTNGVTRTVNVLTGQGFNLSSAANQATFANAGGVLNVDPLIRSRILDQLPTSGNSTTFGINYLQDINFLRGDNDVRDSYTGRFDLDINDRNSVNAIFKYTTSATDVNGQHSGFSTSQFVTFEAPTYFLSTSWRTSVGNNFSNEARFGFQLSSPFFVGANNPADFFIGGIPVTSPEGAFQDQGRDTSYYTFQDNAVYTWGKHSFRFGGQFDAFKVTTETAFGIPPTYSISTTGNPNTPGITSPTSSATALVPFIDAQNLARINTLRYFLAGIVGSGSISNYLISAEEGYGPIPNRDTLKYETYAAYISDQWRVRPNFTLNLGLRYEFFTPLYTTVPRMLEAVITDPNNFESSMLGPGAYLDYVGTNAGKEGRYFRPDWNNFVPSVSFAYSPQFEKGLFSKLLGGNLVVRGGFRITNINDEYVRAPIVIGTNAGLGRVNLSAVRVGDTSPTRAQLRSTFTPGNNPGFEALPGFDIPGFTPPPRLISTNNAQLNFSSITYGVRPDYEVPQMYEWNVGIQRNLGWGMVGEIRYVGNQSTNLARTIDINEVDIIGTGLLDDFLRAQNNCTLQGQTLLTGPTDTRNPRFICTDPRYNPAIPGSQPLTILQGQFANNGAFLTTPSTYLLDIQQGRVGTLAQRVITSRLFGTAQLQPSYEGLVMEVLHNEGRLYYNALQAEVRRRFSNGLAFQANYTFSKTLGDILSDVNADQSRANVRLVDNNNRGLNYGRPDFDRTHVFNSNVVYELPFGRGKNFLNRGGWLNQVVGGWQVSAIGTYASGQPINITDARGTLGIASNAGRIPAQSSLTREEIKALTGIFVTPNGTFFFNPSILYAEATATGQPTLRGIDLNQPLPAGYTVTTVRAANPIDVAPFPGQVFFYNNAGEAGNIGINSINGTPYFNINMGLSKNIRFGETMRLQLRAEAFNLFNTSVLFYGGATDISSTNFGRITSSYEKRVFQFGARFDF